MDRKPHWIVTADNRHATLYSCRTTPGGELHVDQVRSLENDHGVEHEHHRPTLMGGAERRGAVGRSGARAAPHSVSPGHADEEQHRRFAKDVGNWISSAKELVEGRVTVFAPPHMLGTLRDQLAPRSTSAPHALHVDVREAELTHLRAPELATHPAVMSAASTPSGAA